MKPAHHSWNHRFRKSIRSTFRASALVAIGAAGVLGATLLIDKDSASLALSVFSSTQAPASSTGTRNTAEAARTDSIATVPSAELKQSDVADRVSATSQLLAGQLTSLDGDPIHKGRVFAIHAASDIITKIDSGFGVAANTILEAAHSAETDEFGKFSISVSNPGEYYIFSASPGSGPAARRVQTDGSFIQLVSSANHTIRGEVTNELDEPIHGVNVAAVHPRGVPSPKAVTPEDRLAFAAFRAETVTDFAGRFELNGLDDATFTILAYADARATAKVANVRIDNNQIKIRLTNAATLGGLVVDDQLNPIANAAIGIARIALGSGDLEEGTDLVTDTNGNFLATDTLTGGEALILKVIANGFATRQVRCRPLSTGEVFKQTIMLDRAASLRVHVTDSLGKPLPSVYAEALEVTTQALLGSPLTDEQGNVVFTNANANDRYHVRAGGNGYAIGSVTGVTTKDAVIVKIPATYSLTGTVVDEKDRPVAQATISIRREIGREEDSKIIKRVTTDASGSFLVSGLGEGIVTVTVTAEGFAPEILTPIAVPRIHPNLQFKLSRGFTGAGRIVDSRGISMPNVRVSIPELSPNSQRARHVFTNTVVTNSDGYFSIKNVHGDVRGLLLKGENSFVRFASVRPTAGDGQTLYFGDVVWNTGGGVEGIVRDTAGAAVPNIKLMLFDQFLAGTVSPTTTTNKEGEFRFVDIAPGHYSIDVLDSNYSIGGARRTTHEVEVLPGELKKLVLDASQWSRVEGKVSIRGALPQSDLEVVLRSPGEYVAERSATTVRWDGTFELIAPGFGRFALEIRSQAGDSIYSSRMIQISSNQTHHVDIEIGPNKISGMVVYKDTLEPIKNASVAVEDSTTGSRIVVNTDHLGRYSVSGLSSGNFALSAHARGFARSAPQNVYLELNQTKEVQIELTRGTNLIVKTVSPDGNAIPNARVKLWTSDAQKYVTINYSNQFGEVDFETLPSAAYIVTIEHEAFEGFEDEIFVGPDLPAKVLVRAKSVGKVVAKVRNANGEALAGQEAWLTTSTGMGRRVVSNWEGIATFQTAAEGAATLELSSGASIPVVVRAGETAIAEVVQRED